jgi:5-methylcytosine-specific restriction endonuclease McrA
VIRLVHFVRVPFRASAPLSRRAVFARDNHRCQYCGRAAENLDHVVPRSRRGPHTWDNVVASCRSCNARKGDRLPSECGMAPRRKPVAPPATQSLIVSAGQVGPAWRPYLSNLEAVSA